MPCISKETNSLSSISLHSKEKNEMRFNLLFYYNFMSYTSYLEFEIFGKYVLENSFVLFKSFTQIKFYFVPLLSTVIKLIPESWDTFASHNHGQLAILNS